MWRQCLPTVRVIGGGNTWNTSYRAHTAATSVVLRRHGSGSHPPRSQIAFIPDSSSRDTSPLDLRDVYTTIVVDAPDGSANPAATSDESTFNLCNPDPCGATFTPVTLNTPLSGPVHLPPLVPSATLVSTSQGDVRVPSREASGQKEPADEDNAVSKLLDILSAPSIQQTPSVIRSLYYSVSSRGQLSMLTSAHFTTLLRLFGTLSLSSVDERHQSKYAYSLSSDLPERSFRPFWPFLVTIGVDKTRMKFPLNFVDHHWLLLAQLSVLDAACRSGNKQRSWLQTKLRVVQHHHRMLTNGKPLSSHEEHHMPYLRFLLAHSFPAYQEEAVKAMSELVTKYDDCPAWLLSYLWKLVMNSRELSDILKARILDALGTRLHRLSVETPPHAETGGKQDPAGSGQAFEQSGGAPAIAGLFRDSITLPHAQGPDVLLASTLVEHFKQALFTRTTPSASNRGALDSELKEWALALVHTVFAEDVTLGRRWSSLYLLALSNASSRSTQRSEDKSSPEPEAVVEWRTICALSSIEQLVRPFDKHATLPFTIEVNEGLSRVLDALWHTWTSTPANSVVRLPITARVICASFYYLGGRFGNSSLIQRCRVYCTTSGLWKPIPVDSSSPASIQTLAAEQLISSIATQQRVDHAYRALISSLSDERLLGSIVNIVVGRVVPETLPAVQILYKLAADSNAVSLYAPSMAKLTLTLAQCGFVNKAVQYLDFKEFRDEEPLVVLAPLLPHIAYLIQRLQQKNALILGLAMLHAFRSPPPYSVREDVQRILLALPQRRNIPEIVVKVVEMVANQRPTFFKWDFYYLLFRRLLRHRQFSRARLVFDLAVQRSPRIQRRWTELFISACIRSGSLALARKTAWSHRLRSQTEVSSVARLARRIVAHKHSVRRVATLRMPAIAAHSERSKPGLTCSLTTLLLLRAGRPRAALDLVARMRPDLTAQEIASVGNSILHARSKGLVNAAGFRILLKILERLGSTCGFAPDRVTINIILGALLRWRAVDQILMRRLFSKVLQSGYPGGRREHRVFEYPFYSTSRSGGQRKYRRPPAVSRAREAAERAISAFSLPASIKEEVSFEKHVRPLYRSFIKYFRQRKDMAAVRAVESILVELEEEWAGRSNGSGDCD
ncbi:hypothetical protein CERSUDRAFT_127490 [Gelatoporia subvermispora B]|uniref:Uncharacterized protein n=1 Tax=Ceriporiopsis subvermispora (strain B) TaxID=914234 RepID=M2QH08_CERS8|nr:hypothetical protein CERSUDRAFT_127490 [Gelatoporia subvermispora B]